MKKHTFRGGGRTPTAWSSDTAKVPGHFANDWLGLAFYPLYFAMQLQLGLVTKYLIKSEIFCESTMLPLWLGQLLFSTLFFLGET